MSTTFLARWSWLPLAAGYPLLLWWHAAALLKKTHFQFLMVLPLLVWILARSRSDDPVTPGRYGWGWLALAGLAGSAGLLGLASWVWSPWGATLSALVASGCWLWTRTGWGGMARWGSAWLMCWVLLPLPFGWDDRLTVALRGVTTRLTSQLLDFIGSLHLSYMNVIELPNKKLFIADACSGVQSLYLLLAAALFWGLFQRRSAVHTLLLLGGTFGIVILENLARLVTIVLGLNFRVDLSGGPDHAALGVLLFLLATLLVMSTDQLLVFLLPRGVLKFLMARRRTDPARGVSTTATAAPGWLRGATTVLCCLFPLGTALQVTRLPGPLPNLAEPFQSDPELKELGAAGLPEVVAGFNRLEYSRIERVLGDPFGQQSQQWTYAGGPLVAQVSIDYPYDGTHDATICYAQIGWVLDDAAILTDETAGRPAPYGLAKLSRALDGTAVLLFSQIDQAGVCHARLKDGSARPRVRDAVRRFESFLQSPAAASPGPMPAVPLVQVQLLARSSQGLTDADVTRLTEFYLEMRLRIGRELGLFPAGNGADGLPPAETTPSPITP